MIGPMSKPPLAVHETEVRVRYPEVDAMGVVHHARYAEYFEIGRTEMLRGQGIAYRDLEAAGVFLVVVKLEVRFRAPARYDDLLRIQTRLDRLGGARIDHSYRLFRKADNALLAEGRTTLGCLDRDGRIQPLPEDLFAPRPSAAPAQ